MRAVGAKGIHSNRMEIKDSLAKILVHLAGDKLPDQFHPTLAVKIPGVDVVAIQVHLGGHIVVRGGKCILVPRLLGDQEPLGGCKMQKGLNGAMDNAYLIMFCAYWATSGDE